MTQENKATRSVRYRVLPGTRAKARQLNRLAGACRYVWNEMLDQQQILHDTARMFGAKPPSPTYFTLGKSFTELRGSNGHEWLKELPFSVVRYTLKHQADAWQGFFKGQRRRPKFKGRGCGMGFTIPEKVRICNGCIAVPRIGEVRLRRRGGNPYPDGIPKQAVFKRERGKWFCTVSYEVGCEAREDDGAAVGVDRNIGQCALSTGEIIRMPDLSRLEARKRRYQRRMARRRKGSNRRERTRSKLARTHARIRGIRSNWAHQASRRIADAGHTTVIEDLNTKAMTRSAKGTAAAPGTNVRGKSGLNRAILASGWGSLEHHLEYKAGCLIRTAAPQTSRTCHECGNVDAASRPNQSTFRCQVCDHEANADVNAALNIRRQGLARLDGEGRGCKRTKSLLARPMSRQTGGGLRQAA
ncbi:MAG: transposase [Gammaproteobacteria bacterium]|nr:transposase [Gammaproteobacteria bacterium]MDE0273373.1 transposase [Gammaproteobacteria bacterium]